MKFTAYSFKLTAISCLIFALIGCDAFVRKFTRKPKKENLPKEELVLEPEEYKSTLTNQERYSQYFLFWKSWQDELIDALVHGISHKKQLSCINEAVKNLSQLNLLLNPQKQKELEVYLIQLRDLQSSIVEDTYGLNLTMNRLAAERLKRKIIRDFSYTKIKDFLI